MDVSVIIVNYKTSQLILNCLDSVYKFTKNVTMEVVVVDNDPQNGDQKVITGKYPGIRWLDMTANGGFGRANNEGMKIAAGRYFLLLNADTLVTDNVIGRCVQRLDARPDIVACGAMQYYPDGSPMPFYKSFNDFRRSFFILPPGPFFSGLLERFLPDPVYEDPDQYDWLVGAFIMVRREAALATRGFDEEFFMYGEDVEWSGRLGKIGKLCYFNDCMFIHLENQNPFRRTNISWINRFSTQMQVSNLVWLKKQYGRLTSLFLLIHYLLMVPVVFLWRFFANIREGKKPFTHFKTQFTYTRKVGVLLKYSWRILYGKKYFYKIAPHENIDLIATNERKECN